MRKSITLILPRLLLEVWFIVAFLIAGDIKVAKGQAQLTVEGEWEMVSTNTNPWKQNVGKKISISRNGNSYDLKRWDGEIKTYQGTETQIVRSSLEYVCDPKDLWFRHSICDLFDDD